MEITIKDIAKNCNVSKGLVSRIINGDPNLRCSSEIKKRVLDEIEKQGFIPNIHARMLSKKTVKPETVYNLGYVSYTSEGFMGHPYFDKIIEGVISEIKQSRCNLVIGTNISDVYKKYKNDQPLCEYVFDGLILFGEIADKGLCEYLKSQAKYIISICNQYTNMDADFVGCDLSETITLMLQHIKNLNYTQIGLICGTDDLRKDNVMHIINQLGLTIDSNFLLDGKYNTNSSYEEIKKALSKAAPPKVICCLNDEMAIGCIRALQELGYKVPDDVSVTGHDDILRATYFEVPLTTVRIYKEEIGKLAVTILKERILSKRKYPIRIIIPGKLIKRESLKANREGI